MNPSILSLHTYPVKSCAGITHERVCLDRGGLSMDRQWIIVDAYGVFMTQRTHARMALIKPGLPQGSTGPLTLDAPGMPQFVLSEDHASEDTPAVPLRVWAADTLGRDVGDDAARWLGEFLQVPCRLLRVHPRARRLASPERIDAWRERHADWAPDFPADHVFAFADGYPFLVTNQGSLDELNRRLVAQDQPAVPMNRFRPNIVVAGLDGYEEDYLSGLRVGSLTFAIVKRCARCPIPNIDQETAVSAPATGLVLAQHRQFPEGVLFGVNAVVQGADDGAWLQVGDTVQAEYNL